jgi:hypothetical protein
MSSNRIPNSLTRISGSRLAGVAAVAVLGGTLLAPAAHADSKAAPLKVAVSDVTHNTLTRGKGTNSFTVTVTNTTDTAQPFSGDAMMWPGASGPSPLTAGQVLAGVVPVHAPATDVSVRGQNPGLNVMFFPHGGTLFKSAFQIPAGAAYSWKVTVGAAAGFPGNDDGLDIEVTSDRGEAERADVHFDIAPALPDGRLTETFDRSVTVAPGSPGETTLELHNGAGGEFTSPLSDMVYLGSAVPGLGLEYRSGGNWVPAKVVSDGQSWLLPEVPAGFAYQQTHSYRLRFTAAKQPAAPRDVSVSSRVVLGEQIAGAQTTLHLKKAAKPAAPATPTATATASAPASPTSAAVPAATGTSGATSGGSSPSTTQLAHTGASHTGLLAGLAALLAAAGAFLTVSVKRRRSA